MTTSFCFAEKNVIVTGGASGIGLEISRRLLAAGARVRIWDFSEAALTSARAALAGHEERVLFQKVNVASMSSCEEAASAVYEPIHILINNADITRDKSLAKMSAEDFDAVVATNLSGVFYVTKSLLPKFAAQAPKRIISISSVVAHYGNFGQSNYVAAKSGVIGLTKTWARELGGKGFTANAVAPGFTLTPMVEAMPSASRERIESKIPVGRLGHPEDIAHACLFLASDEASYINGAVLSVDGGLVF